MINVETLNYTYPRAREETLKGIEFTVREREIFGFLGPSGSGKSTTQKILTGLLPNYQGRVELLGRSLNEWGYELYENVGVSFESPNHYHRLTALENLQHFGLLYQGPCLSPLEALEWVDLNKDAHKRVIDFSKGMKIRLNLARSLLHRPKLLFLDEPTSGLDPVNAQRIKDLILRLKKEGTTIFLTTHDMGVAAQLCDRVAFITSGQINTIGAPRDLEKRYGRRAVRVAWKNSQDELQHQEFPLDGLGENTQFSEILRAKNIESIHSQETTLEHVFIEVTGKSLQS